MQNLFSARWCGSEEEGWVCTYVVTCSTSTFTLLRVGGDGGAHAVGADSLNRSGHRELLQTPFEVAVLSLQLLLRVQSLLVLLFQLLQKGDGHVSPTQTSPTTGKQDSSSSQGAIVSGLLRLLQNTHTSF